MKKQSALIAVMGLISVAAAFALTIAYNSAARKTPDFVFPDPSPAPANTAEAESSVPLSTESPAETSAPTRETEETEETFTSIITSNNPTNFLDIRFEGFDIIIEGVSADRSVISACLFSNGKKEEAAYDGDNYRIVLSSRKKAAGYDSLYIYTDNDTILNYRVYASPNGFEPIDTADIAERNLYLAETPLALPLEGVLQYITPDGDAEKAREVMAQAEEISDRICEGITEDYDKALAISKWIAENIYYDFDARDNSVTTETISLSHVLETHRTVCGGFSNIFCALCAAQGITAYNIQGEAINDVLDSFAESGRGNRHEWNYAVIDGRGIWVDACWDTYNFYIDGVYVSDKTRVKYFDITNTVLSYDHRARICQSRDYYAALEE